MKDILFCWPFRRERPPVQVVEGYEKYDGTLGDKPGDPHKGIDYVRKREEKHVSFQVCSAHGGEAFQGESETWGTFVVVRSAIIVQTGIRYDTIYAHLRDVDETIPPLPGKYKKRSWPEEVKPTPKGLMIASGHELGMAGISGKTNRIIQLHFELHRVNVRTGQRKKLDPYGVNDRFSSGRYPQPGQSLVGLDHSWNSDDPPFAP